MKNKSKLCIFSLLFSHFFLTNLILAKGLDDLQAETHHVPEEPNSPPESTKPMGDQNLQQPAHQDVTYEKTVSPQQTAAGVAGLSSDPGLQKFYLVLGLSAFKVTTKKASLHSTVAGDIEIGRTLFQIPRNIKIFGTYRYLSSDITATADQRAYRGVLESHLFGAKAFFSNNPKLLTFATAELGLAKTHLTVVDGRSGQDIDLTKPGVELKVGGGVSYLVIDKLGIGTRVAFGTLAYNTIQFGLDIQFLF